MNRTFQEAHDNPSEVFCVMWSPAGRYLASGGGDRKVKLWSTEDGKLLAYYLVYIEVLTVQIGFGPSGQ